MKLSLLLVFTFFIGNTAFLQYCESPGPNTLVDSNVESVDLVGNGNSINFIGCPAQLGFNDQTNLTATITAGVNYALEVQFGTCDGNYAGLGEAWIDFNQNEIFELSESIGTWTGTPPTNLSVFNFAAPTNTINGTTRLRVIQREGGSLPLDPCGSFQWGSATDFSIEITGGIDCSPFVGDTEEDAVKINTIPYSGTFDNSYCYFSNNVAYPSPDIYFLLDMATTAHSVTVSLCGSSFDTFLSVFDKVGNTIAFNDDSELCGSQSEVRFNINGRDSILIIVEGWGDEQGEFDISVSGQFLNIQEPKAETYTIFPNPASDFIYIKGLAGQEVRIYDYLGKLVQGTTYSSNEQLSISDLAPGFYTVSFLNGEILKTKPLIKQ